jgi:adenylate kinase
MDAGELVPDDVVIGIVRERLQREDVQRNGILLDGFPRTVAQAESLAQALHDLAMPQPVVVNLEVDDEEVVRRLSARRVCRDCGAIFSLRFDAANVDEPCPQCGGTVYQRDDDKPAAILQRLRVYYEQTAPLIELYQKNGLLVSIPAAGAIEDVTRRLVAAVQERIGG